MCTREIEWVVRMRLLSATEKYRYTRVADSDNSFLAFDLYESTQNSVDAVGSVSSGSYALNRAAVLVGELTCITFHSREQNPFHEKYKSDRPIVIMVRIFKSLFVIASFVVATIGAPTAAQKTGIDVGNELENINAGLMSPLAYSIDHLPTDPTQVTHSQTDDISKKLTTLASVLVNIDKDVLAVSRDKVLSSGFDSQNTQVGTFTEDDGKYVIAELAQVQFKLNLCLDNLAAKASSTFSTDAACKSNVGQQLKGLYGAYDTISSHIFNASPTEQLKARAQSLADDGKGHFQQAVSAYGVN
ncbi:hypothetical protein WG66_001542 [Moniliophthora roreri]|nr:hypothetical protein WG66_001542 [Moniliophthora roreri]